MTERNMRVVVVRPGEPAVAETIDGSLTGLQKMVGGMIEVTYPYKDRVGIVTNEEGKLLGLLPNRVLRDDNGKIYDVIAGSMLVVGLSEDDFTSLTPTQERRFLEEFRIPERIESKNGKVVVTRMDNLMNLEQFRSVLAEDLIERLKEDGLTAIAECATIEKVQGSYQGITIQVDGEPMRVSFDPSEGYQLYRKTGSYAMASERTYESVKNALDTRPELSTSFIGDYEWAKKHLSVEVINTRLNCDYLKKIPHREMEDLSVIYRLHLAEHSSDEAATALVTNDMIKVWGVTEKKLNEDAVKSSEERFPLQIMSLREMLGGLTGSEEPDYVLPLYVATAVGKQAYGSGVMTYPGFEKEAREVMHGDYYLLPSSRHELILAPAHDMDPKMLAEIVQSVNATQVSPIDFLSDSVYRYSPEERKLKIVAGSALDIVKPVQMDIAPKRQGR